VQVIKMGKLGGNVGLFFFNDQTVIIGAGDGEASFFRGKSIRCIGLAWISFHAQLGHGAMSDLSPLFDQ
jgi:hypothetical protein